MTKARLSKREVAEQTQPLRKLLVVGCHHPAFASGDHFVCIKTETRHVAKASRHATATCGTVRLGTIFDNEQIVTTRNIHEQVHIDRMPIEMHRYDGLYFFCN